MNSYETSRQIEKFVYVTHRKQFGTKQTINTRSLLTKRLQVINEAFPFLSSECLIWCTLWVAHVIFTNYSTFLKCKRLLTVFLEANVLKLLIPLAGGFPSLHPFPFSSTTSRSLLLFYPISSSLLNLKLNL